MECRIVETWDNYTDDYLWILNILRIILMVHAWLCSWCSLVFASFTILFRDTPLALGQFHMGQLCNCPSANEPTMEDMGICISTLHFSVATLKDMGKYCHVIPQRTVSHERYYTATTYINYNRRNIWGDSGPPCSSPYLIGKLMKMIHRTGFLE